MAAGHPMASIAAPPIRPSRTSTGRQACKTESATAVTSGPIPSPRKDRYRGLHWNLQGMGPAALSCAAIAALAREQELELVDPVQQAVTGEGVDGERRPGAVGELERALAEVDRHLGSGRREQPGVGLRVHDNRAAVRS